jgi:hypothetical protein
MFLSPSEKTYSYTTGWKVIAWLPLVAVALIGAAVVYPDWQNLEQPGWLIALMVTAGLSVFLSLFMSRELVSIHNEVIARSGLFGAKEIRWEQVQETRYSQTMTAQNVGIHFGLIGMVIAAFAARKADASKATQYLKIVSQDGTKISFSNYLQNHRELMRAALSRVNPRLLNEFRSRIKQGIPAEFGKLQLSLEGARWGSKGPLPYQQIESAGMRGQSFCIKATGKWMNFLSVRASRVPNLFVAVDLIEEFKSGAVKSQPEQLSFSATV